MHKKDGFEKREKRYKPFKLMEAGETLILNLEISA